MIKFFITGQMRSGTTLLCNFINSQKNITAWPDIFHSIAGKIFTPKKAINGTVYYNEKLSTTTKLYLLYTMSHGIDVLKINKKVNYEMHYNPKDFETALDLYNILLKSIISSNDKAVGHKVTGCEHNIINILNQTDIKVIYIYRDPRDVIPSALKKKFIPNVELGCMQWNNAINTALSIKHINYFTLKFEDLVASKTGLVQRLSDFLNVKITLDIDKILHYDEKFISNSSYDDINSLFSPIAAYRWKTNKDPNLTKTVYDLCRQEILKAGYQQP